MQKYSLEKYVCCEYIWAKMLCEDILVKIENILRKESVILHARARCWSGSVPIITPERRLEQTAQRVRGRNNERVAHILDGFQSDSLL